MTSTVLQGTAFPAYSITPPDTLGYYPQKLFEYNPEKAQQLMAEAGYPDGKNWPGIEIIYNTSEAHRKIAVAIQQMWSLILNIRVTLSNQNGKSIWIQSIKWN